MKYCRKCGMLLEDTYETCIRCGADVTIEDNVSLYPPEVMDTLDAQKEERGNRIKITMLIIAILVALAAVVAIAAVGIANGSFQLAGIGETMTASEPVEEEIEEEEEEPIEEPAEEENEEEPVARVVKDDKGTYYDFLEEKDEAGNVVFNAICPEDFDNIDFGVEYDKCSTRYPFGMKFIASGEDGGIQFLYMSPQQLWYKLSETGHTRSNERDPSYYMSFYAYGGVKSYIEDMLKASYPKGKFNCISEEEVSPLATESLKLLSEEKSSEIDAITNDYVHAGEDTTYSNMDSEYSALVYEYEITTSDKQMIFDKFYVPVVANNFYYSSDKYNDRGTVTEWYILAFTVMEAGNEDLYEDYSDAFDIFALNAYPTETFIKLNQLYSEEIKESVAANRAIDPMSIEMLEDYSKQATENYSLDKFNQMAMDVLYNLGAKEFRADDYTVYTDKDMQVAFIDEQNAKLFVSKEADEYPGDEYLELLCDEEVE